MALEPDQVRAWWQHAHGSPLYAGLVETLADDPELMRVLNRIEHAPEVNLFLGAIHLLLMEGEGPDLARYYASVTESPLPPDGSGPVFRDFVLEHEDEIARIGATRYTQTNECRRCAVLLPGVFMAPFHRFHLIEIGTSAGLNLALDRYGYRWDDLTWGTEGASLVLESGSRGRDPDLHPIEILTRTGLDLDPVMPDDEEGRRWLDALIWPDQAERRHRLRAGFEVVSGLDITMIAGDAADTLPGALDGLPDDDPVVVMDSFSLFQMSPEGRSRVESAIGETAGKRPVHRVSFEIARIDDEWATLLAGGPSPEVVGQAHPHGEWLELYPA